MVKESNIQVFNIMSHDLVPIHEIISEEEKKELFENIKISLDQLPKLLDTDPVCVSIGAKPGQIIKINRKSYTAKEAEVYRLVVESND
jgi:DNA-directed RNA polymerase subunit H